MVNRKNINDEKLKPGLSFLMSIPVRFEISSTKSEQTILRNYAKQHNTSTSAFLLQKLLDYLDVVNVKQLLSTYKSIRISILDLKKSIKDEMGVDENDFSSHFRTKILCLKDA